MPWRWACGTARAWAARRGAARRAARAPAAARPPRRWHRRRSRSSPARRRRPAQPPHADAMQPPGACWCCGVAPGARGGREARAAGSNRTRLSDLRVSGDGVAYARAVSNQAAGMPGTQTIEQLRVHPGWVDTGWVSPNLSLRSRAAFPSYRYYCQHPYHRLDRFPTTTDPLPRHQIRAVAARHRHAAPALGTGRARTGTAAGAGRGGLPLCRDRRGIRRRRRASIDRRIAAR